MEQVLGVILSIACRSDLQSVQITAFMQKYCDIQSRAKPMAVSSSSKGMQGQLSSTKQNLTIH